MAADPQILKTLNPMKMKLYTVCLCSVHVHLVCVYFMYGLTLSDAVTYSTRMTRLCSLCVI